MEKITLEDIAGQVHLCRSECCRFFKNYMQRSLFDYLLYYRIEKACRFLGNIICLSRRRQNGPDFPVRNILPRYSGNRWDALQVFTEAAGRRKIRILFKQFLYAGSQFFAFTVSKEQLLEMFAGQGTFYQFQVQFF